MFEPGYTTHDEGTGFGLAIGERIATGHGWNVRLGSCDDGCRIEVTDVARCLTGGDPAR